MNERERQEWDALVVRCHLSVNVRWTELVLLADTELRELRARVAELDAENAALMAQVDDLATKCEAVEGMTTVQSLAHVAVGNGVEWVLYDDLDVLRDGATPWQALNAKEEK